MNWRRHTRSRRSGHRPPLWTKTRTLVLIFYPKEISDRLQYAVDRHVVNGGNVIAFVDPLSLIDRNSGQPGGASLDALFKSWGVSMATDSILVDMDQPTRLAAPNNRTEINPTWVSLEPRRIQRRQYDHRQARNNAPAHLRGVQKTGTAGWNRVHAVAAIEPQLLNRQPDDGPTRP